MYLVAWLLQKHTGAALRIQERAPHIASPRNVRKAVRFPWPYASVSALSVVLCNMRIRRSYSSRPTHSRAWAHQSMQEAPGDRATLRPHSGHSATCSCDQISTSAPQKGQSMSSGRTSLDLVAPGQPLNHAISLPLLVWNLAPGLCLCPPDDLVPAGDRALRAERLAQCAVGAVGRPGDERSICPHLRCAGRAPFDAYAAVIAQ